MPDFRKVTDAFFVSPQISEADIDAAAEAGVKTIISNRPDGEAGPFQPKEDQLRARAEGLGLAFVSIPFQGFPSEDVVARMGDTLAQADAPILAFCRSGTRSITAWALAQHGAHDEKSVIALAAEAGYDLSGLRGRL
ncbi:MAG: TIGR01244 family sulfur transferase [Pseudomonadota bacterium]